MWSDRRRLILGLAGSLLLNVFLLGVVVGHGFATKRGPRAPAGLPPIAAKRYVDALPKDQKDIFQAAMATHRKEVSAARRSHHAAREKAEDDIAAPTLDSAAVAADLAALHQANRAVEDTTSAALLEALPALSPAARAALVGRKLEPRKP